MDDSDMVNAEDIPERTQLELHINLFPALPMDAKMTDELMTVLVERAGQALIDELELRNLCTAVEIVGRRYDIITGAKVTISFKDDGGND